MQRQRRAVTRNAPDELELFALLAQRFGIDVSPWPNVPVEEQASLPPRTAATAGGPPVAPPEPANGGGLRLLPYRPLFAGAAVERVPQLAFQRPLAEIELSAADAKTRGVWTGDAVSVGSNGTARTLTVKVNRRLLDGVARSRERACRRPRRGDRSGEDRVTTANAALTSMETGAERRFPWN